MNRLNHSYHNHHWGDEVPMSGYGSSLEKTANIRKTLPQLFKLMNFTSILEAPCGDFTWMPEVLKQKKMQYIGADTVADLIADLKANHTNRNTHFEVIDIIDDELPMVDVMLVRDCLFHLPPSDIMQFFINFSYSEIPYLLTHRVGGNPGDFGLLNPYLNPYVKPYHFPEPLWKTNEEACKELCMWHRDQVEGAALWR